MAVIATNETVAARSLSVKVGEGFTYTRSFNVQVDTPGTPLLEIAAAPGVKLWASHPEDSKSKAQSFDIKPRGSSLLLYEVSITYAPVDAKDENRSGSDPGGGGGGTVTAAQIPHPEWSGGTTSVMVPFTEDITGKAVANSAGVPFDDAEKKVPAPTLTCVKCFTNYQTMIAARSAVMGKTNNAAWAGGAVGEWLCDTSRWSWKYEGTGNGTLAYVEASFEFVFMKDGWDLQLIDRGYSMRVDDTGTPTPGGNKLKPIVGQDKKPAREPVALDGAGAPMEPPPGPGPPPIKPVVLKFQAYERADFKTHIGEPP